MLQQTNTCRRRLGDEAMEIEKKYWFPAMLDLKGRRCLVAGGGTVALRKTEKLLNAGAAVTVVSPRFDLAFEELDATLVCRLVQQSDVPGSVLAVDATNDPAVAAMLSEVCGRNNVWFDSASSPEKGTMQFPAVLRQGNLTVSVSTGGDSPAAAALLCDRIASCLPKRLDEILSQQQQLRQFARQQIPDKQERAAFIKSCLIQAIQLERPLTEEELLPLWKGFAHEQNENTPGMPRAGDAGGGRMRTR